MTSPSGAGTPKLKVLVIPPEKLRTLFVLRHVVTGQYLSQHRVDGGPPVLRWVASFRQARLFNRMADLVQSQKVLGMEKMTEILRADAYLQNDVIEAATGEA